ncbi:hypothetical protein JCM18909_936 [Cutibacterium acnes JCM 18909]|nr:hypothetical protein JCM18909_936 [Cutibacterium acnes JCM 18909]
MFWDYIPLSDFDSTLDPESPTLKLALADFFHEVEFTTLNRRSSGGIPTHRKPRQDILEQPRPAKKKRRTANRPAASALHVSGNTG